MGKTATMIAPYVEVPLDDIKQILMVKVWKAVQRYDPEKARGMDEERYVFMCLRDQAKSIIRLKRHGLLSLDELRRGSMNGRVTEVEAFDARYLAQDSDYDHVGEDPDLPESLSALEREIVVRLYRDYKQAEIAREMGLTKTEMERHMKSIRGQLEPLHRPASGERPDSPPPASTAGRHV